VQAPLIKDILAFYPQKPPFMIGVLLLPFCIFVYWTHFGQFPGLRKSVYSSFYCAGLQDLALCMKSSLHIWLLYPIRPHRQMRLGNQEGYAAHLGTVAGKRIEECSDYLALECIPELLL